MRRQTRERAPVVLRAAFVSQLTCLQLLGVDDRRYLESVLPLCKGHVTHVGRLRLVPLDVAVSALEKVAQQAGDVTGLAQERHVERQPETAAEVLALLGRRRIAA